MLVVNDFVAASFEFDERDGVLRVTLEAQLTDTRKDCGKRQILNKALPRIASWGWKAERGTSPPRRLSKFHLAGFTIYLSQHRFAMHPA
jgi:hypothetical protein